MKAKRGEEALMRLLAKSVSAQRDAVYLERDGETVWFPHRGSVAGFHLIHRSGADCRYAFLPERVGPFPTDIGARRAWRDQGGAVLSLPVLLRRDADHG